MAVSQITISIIHRLEQVSSNEHVGSLAENLLEALCTNKRVAELIEEARQHTRSEKKRLAMAMRERQLGALGMQTNDKGQVTASGTILQQMEDLGDETGLICVICREGYKFKPNMVIYLLFFVTYLLTCLELEAYYMDIQCCILENLESISVSYKISAFFILYYFILYY